jgi:preprotein translocase subunit SecG
MLWFEWFMIPAALVVIVSVLLQKNADTALDAFTGSVNDNLFKNKKIRGPELFLNYATLISSILLVILLIISSAMNIRWDYQA